MRYFNLFSSILVTKGATRILISDLERNISEIYSIELYNLLKELKNNSIEDVIKSYDTDSKAVLDEYIDFLLEEEYGFITYNDWDKDFDSISLNFNDSDVISNLFLELDNFSILHKIRLSIEKANIRYLVIYSVRKLSNEELIEIDFIFKNSSLEGIEIFCPYHDKIDDSFLITLSNKSKRIYSLVLYNCNEATFSIKERLKFNLDCTKNNINIKSCGIVDLKYFNTNSTKILESKNFNSCLYKKIGIDAEGNIKNCPAFDENFGNIENVSLEEVLSIKKFKKYWNLTKDDIEICKDCEFRYICTDCRAYTERTHQDKEGIDTSKPLKCGYNPYTGEWEEWSTNPLKQKGIKYYGFNI
jgi:SPASM domain peptide maturase of grasp-with-spasm system